MNQEFNKGLFLTSLGSFWWGFIGVIYFKYLEFIGFVEVVIHRCLWTAVTLIITTFFFSKWNTFFSIITNKKNLIGLFFSGFLIFINWAVWIYAVATDRIIDASFGYFIMPILSVFLGYIFFKERLNKKRIFSISLVIISIIILLFFSMKSLPWVGIVVGISWGFYNLIRKKINVDTDIGLLIESLFILPFALIAFYYVYEKGLNDFSFSNPELSLFIMLAGPMTVIPLFLYVRGVELSGLGPAGMIFYITPTLQFLLGYFYYDEPFSTLKLGSFILIWIAVIIYLKNNISENTFNLVMANVRYLPKVIEYDRFQPEFYEDTKTYIEKRTSKQKQTKGKNFYNNNKNIIEIVEDEFNIEKELLLALMGIETNFGTYVGKMDILSSLATLSYDKRRSDFFTNELITLLKLIEDKKVDYQTLYGSWAGAFGFFQFMPSTITNYALDYNNDKKINLKDNEDAYPSAANYLNQIGWKKNEPCFYRIDLNENIPKKYLNVSAKKLQNKKKLSFFKKYINNYSELDFLNDSLMSAIITPDKDIIPDAETLNPAYIVFDNYEVILKWNRSLRFALAVCTLKDKFKNEI